MKLQGFGTIGAFLKIVGSTFPSSIKSMLARGVRAKKPAVTSLQPCRFLLYPLENLSHSY